MKKQSIFFIAALVMLTFLGNAQTRISIPAKPSSTTANLPSMDAFAVIPIKDCGFGLGFNFLSKPVNIGSVSFDSPIQMRVGGEFYFSELHHKNLGTVPLSAPQTGNARVRLSDDVFGLNGMARFSLPYSKKITPYLDVFGGLRAFSVNMNITPEIHVQGNEQSTSENLSTIAQFNYGGTIGVLVSLGEWVKFNAGIMYSHSKETGEIVNIRKAYVESGNIVTDKMLTGNGLLMAKVGFTFLIQKNNNPQCNNSNPNRGGYRYYGSGFSGGSSGGTSNHVNFSTRPSK